jgi:hydrogenase nickel incorporation protein HypA/HybF
MHELSIVEALIDQVGRELHRAGPHGSVRGLELSIGRLSGVHCESVRFAFDLLSPGTPVENATIVIHEPKAVSYCNTCHARVEIDDLVIQCPQCSSADIVIEGGRDLMLQSIELEELST